MNLAVHYHTPGAMDRIERRTHRFLQRWLFLFEQTHPQPEAFRNLLAREELSLGFRGTGLPMRSFGEFAYWLSQRRMHMSRHKVRLVDVCVRNNGEILARIDVDWVGTNSAGQQMTGGLRHQWNLIDTGEPFLRMRESQVTVLQPFEVLA